MSLKILDAIPRIAALHWPQRENYAAFSPPVEQTASSNDKQRASPLLNLPRELRDMIYVYFLEAHRSAPPSPPFAGPRIFRLDLEDNDAELVPQKDIAYPVSIPQSNIHALLQVNRRVRSEVLELADKRNRRSKPLPAELDIMATGYVLYPLWTRLPTLASGTATLSVTVNVRIFSPEAFRARDGPPQRPGMAFYAFLTLLNQFVTCGPAFTPLAGCAELFSPIEILDVRLINLDIYTPRMFRRLFMRWFGCVKLWLCERMFGDGFARSASCPRTKSTVFRASRGESGLIMWRRAARKIACSDWRRVGKLWGSSSSLSVPCSTAGEGCWPSLGLL